MTLAASFAVSAALTPLCLAAPDTRCIFGALEQSSHPILLRAKCGDRAEVTVVLRSNAWGEIPRKYEG